MLKTNTKVTKRVNKNLMSFVNDFRNKMKPNVSKNHFPEVTYGDKKLGIDNRGLLYDKKTLRILHKDEAFEVYRYFYHQYINKQT